MDDAGDSVILRPKFRPADCAPPPSSASVSRPPAGPGGSASVRRPPSTPQRACETPRSWRGVGPAILGTTDNLYNRTGKKHYGSVLNFCDPNAGKENLDRPRGKRVCSTSLLSSAPMSPARPLALSTLSAAYESAKAGTQRRHLAQDASPQELRLRGLHVAPVSMQPTDPILQLTLPPRPRSGSATSSHRSATSYAPRQFKPDLLAFHADGEVLQGNTAAHAKLHGSYRYRPKHAYEAAMADQGEARTGRRTAPAHNASAKDVLCSHYAPTGTPERLAYSQESRDRYQKALKEAQRDTRTMREVAAYHRVRSQVSALTFTRPLYECRETPVDLLQPLTAR
eukprot:EG_transcript_15595